MAQMRYKIMEPLIIKILIGFVNSSNAGLLCMTLFVTCRLFKKLLFGWVGGGGGRIVCQSGWIQIRPDVLLGLIWVQTDSREINR